MMYGSWAQHLNAHISDRTAVIDHTRTATYRELLHNATALAAKIGTHRELVLLECENTADWLVAYVAVLLRGHVAILIPAQSMQARNHAASALSATVLLSPETGYRPQRLGAPRPDLHADLSILLSTSGSTGISKFVRLSQQNMLSNAEAIAEYLELDTTECGAVNLPVHYSYGLSIVNSHLRLGATLLMTETSVMEAEFWALCREHGATSFAGVPHSYDLMSRMDLRLPDSLRYFTQAGGRLSPDLVSRFGELARQRDMRFYVMYGQTEAAPRIAWLPPDELQTHPNSIGVAVPGGRMSVQDETGCEVPPETQGELVYEGPNVMMGYATCGADLALGQGPRELRTGDLAKYSHDGFFYITGRMSRFIKIFGNRIGLDDVERICTDAGFSAVATGIDGKLLIATLQTDQTERIKNLLIDQLKLPGHVINVLGVEEYPMLTTGKIDYITLRKLIPAAPTVVPPDSDTPPGSSGTEAPDHMPPANPTEERLVRIWEETLGFSPIGVTDSFLDLGGDSMTAVHLMLEMESSGLDQKTARAILQGATIRDLARTETGTSEDIPAPETKTGSPPLQPGRLLSRMGLHGLRGFLVCVLIAGHWFPGFVARVPAFQGFEVFLYPLFSLSTPGFAIIFGASMGYFSYEAYLQRPAVFYRQIRLGLIMLASAMILISAIWLLITALRGESVTSNGFFSSFYNVLGFYLLALASMPFWFAVLHRAKHIWVALGGMIIAFICLDLFMKWAFIETQVNDLLQLLRLYATAKFSYFNMSVGALLGIGLGLAIHKADDLPFQPLFRVAGPVLIAVGLIWSNATGSLDALLAPSKETTYWRWCLYLGVIFCLTALFWPTMAHYGQRHGVFSQVLKLLMSIGVLALPFFVFHGLILNLKGLSDAAGIPDLVGLLFVLGIFFGVSSLAITRIWRLYFD